MSNCEVQDNTHSKVVSTPPSATVSLDLPTSQNYNVIMVVTDKFIKFGHFIPLTHPYAASMVANLFTNHLFKLHGLPKSIVYGQDPVFSSSF